MECLILVGMILADLLDGLIRRAGGWGSPRISQEVWGSPAFYFK